ncbi:hypothetical protein OG21DRAFT_1509585 [Imleria badia]|nr:hypothetical protein OG21DRAFT_1509585 [Imleria badia]
MSLLRFRAPYSITPFLAGVGWKDDEERRKGTMEDVRRVLTREDLIWLRDLSWITRGHRELRGFLWETRDGHFHFQLKGRRLKVISVDVTKHGWVSYELILCHIEAQQKDLSNGPYGRPV